MKLDELERSMLRAARVGLGPSAEDRRRLESELLASLSVAPSSPRLREVSPPPRGAVGTGPLGRQDGGAPLASGASTGGRIGLVSVGLAAGIVLGGLMGFALGRSSFSEPPASALPAHSEAAGAGAPVDSRELDGALGASPAPEALPARTSEQGVEASETSAGQPGGAVEVAASAENAAPARARRSSAAPRARPESSLSIELAMLQRARRALNADNGRLALGIVEELDERFPRGVLLEERSATRILSLCLLGREQEAESFAAAFLARHPSSVYADRVRASCASESR